MIETDASLVGWGAVCKGVQTGGGLWSREEQEEHINVLELMAGMFAVQAFAKGKQKVHVHLRMDNTSALSYVTRMGGYTVYQTDRGGTPDVGLVLPPTDNPLSITPPRFRQPGSRSRIQAGANISRMKASQEDLQQDMCSFGVMHSGPVHHEVEPPTGQICELETRSRSYDN